jgi:hypothetical protein
MTDGSNRQARHVHQDVTGFLFNKKPQGIIGKIFTEELNGLFALP